MAYKNGKPMVVRTKNGYDYWETISAFQKSIRRGLEKESMFWGIELWQSNLQDEAWNRMFTMISEDVGLAEPNGPAVISSLYSIHRRKIEMNEWGNKAAGKLQYIHAILYLVRAKKSRIVDNAQMYHFEYHKEFAKQMRIPDWALDKHTRKGKAKGRGFEHFFDEGAKVENSGNVDLEDFYHERARDVKVNGVKNLVEPDLFDSGADDGE